MERISRSRSARHARGLLAPKLKVVRERRIVAEEIEKVWEEPAVPVPEPAEPGKELVSRQTPREDLDICSLTDETPISASDLH